VSLVPLLGLNLALAADPAFPEAQGSGAGTPGGRGGRIIEVTNLNDSGPGSLRAALEATGPRIVVFRVSGTIQLAKPIRVRNPYLTVAGQSAPGGGILVRGAPSGDDAGEVFNLVGGVHDVIFRYIRVRSGATTAPPGRGQVNVRIDAGSHDIIIDHCSFSWTLDENFDIDRAIPDGYSHETWPTIDRITVQRCIFAEGLMPHSTGMRIGGEAELEGWRGVHEVDVHHNLFAHNNGRCPGMQAINARIVNNVIYGWGSASVETRGDMVTDFIGNYLRPGSVSDADYGWCHDTFDLSAPHIIFPPPSFYFSGNYQEPGKWDYEITVIHRTNQPFPSSFKRATPLPDPPIPIEIQTAAEAYESVLADVGANRRIDCNGNWVSNPDAVDIRIIDSVKNRTGTLISHEGEVGGYPQIASGTPCQDSDHDGMPDVWEQAWGLNPNSNDSAGKNLHSIYTNVEVYLNGIAPLSSGISAPTNLRVTDVQ